MKIKIEIAGEEKEIADFINQLQNQQTSLIINEINSLTTKTGKSPLSV